MMQQQSIVALGLGDVGRKGKTRSAERIRGANRGRVRFDLDASRRLVEDDELGGVPGLGSAEPRPDLRFGPPDSGPQERHVDVYTAG
ncbi:hypothetical protein AXG93_4346s1030 [Marchantia polymorpha subsp. ruderalis]|uniref:Uncharacterized protein n=1 Tax=Marchantia polymorpha subsp. ruderalis TaxID=1480154 RepID=A0A176WRV3_MARPO|nr:hypothetical protein AXG93_4346s1030 [Marchantia polymorpha subsp. ruderalis]